MDEIISYFMDKGFLVSPEFIKKCGCSFDKEHFFHSIKKRLGTSPLILNDDIYNVLLDTEQKLDINWVEFEKAKTLVEKGKESAIYDTFLNIMNYNLSEEKKIILDSIVEGVSVDESAEEVICGLGECENIENSSRVIVLKSYKDIIKTRSVGDFVQYFRNRFEAIYNLLSMRSEMQNALSIGRLSRKKRGENVYFIGMIRNKIKTKNGNIILEVEDMTGYISAIVMKNKGELIKKGEDVVLDETLGFSGVMGENVIYINDIIMPDIPLSHELKKSEDEVYAVFTSDLHLGLKNFLYDDFLKFIKWLNCEFGNETQKNIASKIKYLFIVGDLVEGIGIYPGQDEDLIINDIYKQYEELARMLDKIRKDITIIICGGNHDAMRIAEPQPIFDRKYAEQLFNLKNVILVSNPSTINIHSSNDFAGFDVLIYHGFSFIYFSDNVPSIRSAGGQSRSDLIMKFYLERRHLAPSHQSTLYVPDPNSDSLVIDKIPDFLITGHIHRLMVGNYRNVTTINAGCWCTTTEEMERRGLVANPSKVPVVNLKTREVKIMNFRGGE